MTYDEFLEEYKVTEEEKDLLLRFIQHFNVDIESEEIVGCFSCDKEFILKDVNDRADGYFCDDCIERP